MNMILSFICILLSVSALKKEKGKGVQDENVKRCSEEFDATNPEQEELCTIYGWLDQDDDGVITFDDLK